MSFFDEICEKIEEIDPSFDRNNKEKLEVAIKCFILTIKDTKIGKDLKEKFMREVVEKEEKIKIDNLIKKFGTESVIKEINVICFEKEILERQLNIAKKYLN